MKVVITEFSRMARDADGSIMPIGGRQLASQKLTAAGNAAAFNGSAKVARIATDTAIHVKLDGAGAADTDLMMPANSVEFFAVSGGDTASIIAA